MWLVPLLGVLGFAGYSSFKKKGGVEGLSEKAARGAIQGAKDELRGSAKQLKKEAVAEARKVYKVALSAGKNPAHAVAAAVLAVKKVFS